MNVTNITRVVFNPNHTRKPIRKAGGTTFALPTGQTSSEALKSLRTRSTPHPFG